ncbi:MAG TPA: SAM-dependent methyltransferase [Dehalococcoidia bacterium]|nr:SAM-dependent methyltransferase [Dehalococcoidia bacterium]
MKKGRPSITAEGVAALRAAEAKKTEQERVCYDPFAEDFLSIKFRFLKYWPIRPIALWIVERIVPGLAGDITGRVRYIDDCLKSCINDGLEQLVILGAGYDSRAYRFDKLKNRVKVFELDHPATQKVKIDKVKKIHGSLSPHVVYIPIDFNKDNLEDKLFEKGYDKNLKTFFIWEGVTMYLSAEAVDKTLDFVARNSRQDSSIIFDYIFKSFLDETMKMEGIEQIEKVRRVYERLDAPLTDERFTFGIPEGTVGEFLSQRGFHQVNEVTGEYLKDTYFKGVNSNRKVLYVCGFVHAIVAPTNPPPKS